MMALSSGPLKILRGEREQGGDLVFIVVDANGCTLADVFDEDLARAIAALPSLAASVRKFLDAWSDDPDLNWDDEADDVVDGLRQALRDVETPQ